VHSHEQAPASVPAKVIHAPIKTALNAAGTCTTGVAVCLSVDAKPLLTIIATVQQQATAVDQKRKMNFTPVIFE
jgi:hypothetical protein